MRQYKTISDRMKTANNQWLDYNTELGIVLSQLHTLEQSKQHLHKKMEEQEAIMHAEGFAVPISWEQFL
jgi:hypothetical protein